MINSYIWDLDGTLLDSYHSIVSSLVEESGEDYEGLGKDLRGCLRG